MVSGQHTLFGDAADIGGAPEGFRYRADILSRSDESALVERVRDLPFENFQFHGHEGKRRVVSFGWRYDFNQRLALPADDIPDFLIPLRQAAAGFAGIEADALRQVLVTEYAAGAAIGWHRDKAVFGDVIGFSLLSACPFRMRRERERGWERFSIVAAPRSAYLMRGASRSEWEHSIPPVTTLRYSITLRTLAVAP